MEPVLAPRASAILYNLLIGRADHRPFLLPANICPIVPITFLKAGAPFEFVDISPVSLHIDLDSALERARRGGISGVLYAHTYGEPSTPFDFFSQLKRIDPSVLIMDDRCLCVPDLEADSANPADVLLYSTGYSKIVDLGFGGYAFLKDGLDYHSTSLPFVASDLEVIEAAYKKSVAAREPFHYQDSDWLETERPSPVWDEIRRQIGAALPRSLEGRREINAIYAANLPVEIQLESVYQTWRFHIRVPDQKAMLERIFTEKCFASSHYASLAGILAEGSCPEAERLAAQVINLFNDHHFTPALAERVCHIILESLNAS